MLLFRIVSDSASGALMSYSMGVDLVDAPRQLHREQTAPISTASGLLLPGVKRCCELLHVARGTPIYYSETCSFFDEHQEDIEQWLLDDHEFSLSEICKEIESVDLLKNAMVWLTVDLYCQEIVIYNETMQPA